MPSRLTPSLPFSVPHRAFPAVGRSERLTPVAVLLFHPNGKSFSRFVSIASAARESVDYVGNARPHRFHLIQGRVPRRVDSSIHAWSLDESF